MCLPTLVTLTNALRGGAAHKMSTKLNCCSGLHGVSVGRVQRIFDPKWGRNVSKVLKRYLHGIIVQQCSCTSVLAFASRLKICDTAVGCSKWRTARKAYVDRGLTAKRFRDTGLGRAGQQYVRAIRVVYLAPLRSICRPMLLRVYHYFIAARFCF